MRLYLIMRTKILNLPGLDEIGLCTSTRWSPGTWQLLLMFHLDRVNRLPEQTQRRVYGCAAPAQRCGGECENFSLGGEPQQKSSNTATTSLTYIFGSFESAASFLRRTPSLLRILHTSHSTHTQYACNPRPEHSRGPLFQHYPSTWVSSYRDWSPLLNTRASSYTSRIGARAWVWAPGQKRY